MTMGPLPMTRIERTSSRLGTRHQLPEPREQVPAVVGSGRGFGVVLHRERRDVEAPYAFQRVVVEVPVGQGHPPPGGRGRGRLSAGCRSPGSLWTAPAARVDGEAVVVAGDLDPSGVQVLHGL